MRLKRRFCLILCLLAALAVLPASALPRLPARAGAVTDAADVLSTQTAADFSAYASEVEAETGLRLQVALVHFLDGLDARAYAEALFSAWGLGDDDILLCGAAGDDAFAAVMGDGAAAVLGFKSADNLLYTSSGFAGLFASQRYDEALGDFCRAFQALLTKQTGAEIAMDGLFGAVAATPAPTAGSELWDDVMDAIGDASRDYQTDRDSRRHAETGMSAGGWIVLALLALLVLGRRGRRRPEPRRGCGCSPLSWLMSLLGINVILDAFRRRP